MDAGQRAAFRRDGYLVIPDAVPAAMLQEANRLYDIELATNLGTKQGDQKGLKDARRHSIGVRPTSAVVDRHGNAYEGRRMWGAPFRYLVDNPAVMPIMREILGDPQYGHGLAQVSPEKRGCIRLDHDNVHYKPPAAAGLTSFDKGGGLHGNPDNWHVTCVYELRSVPAGKGGLGVIAGSHIAPFEQERVQTMDEGWRSEWVDSPWTAPLASWPADVPVHRLEGQAGACIIFSEKLKHGTIPWSSETEERRTLFYKYAPYGMHHGDVGYDTTDPALTAEQRAIVEFSPEWYNASIGLER
jgi:hypothetical protein